MPGDIAAHAPPLASLWHPEKPAKRVAVVGAGLTGLTAAWRLMQHGCQVTVFEKAGHVGGRTMTVRKAGFVFDVGAITMLPTYANVLALANEVGIKQNKISPVIAIPRAGHLHRIDLKAPLRSLFSTKLLSWRGKLRLLGLAPSLAKAWKFARFDTLSGLAGLDTETTSAAVLRLCGQEVNMYVAGPIIRGNTLNSVRCAPFGELLWLLRQYAAPQLYGFDDGMNALAETLAQRVSVQLHAEINSVTRVGEKVRIAGRHNGEFSDEFDAAFIALPPGEVLRLDPTLTARQRGFLRRITPLPSVSLHVGLSKAPPNKETFILPPESEQPDLTTIVLDHNKAPGRAAAGKAVLSFFLSDEWSQKNFTIPDEDLIAVILAKAAPYVGDLSNDVEAYHVQRWSYAIIKSEVGLYSAIRDYEADVNGDENIQSGGDFLSMGMEAGVLAGQAAAHRICNYLARRRP